MTIPGGIACAAAIGLVALAKRDVDRKQRALRDCEEAHQREHEAVS